MCPVCYIVSLAYMFVCIQRHQVHQNKHWMLCVEVKLYRCFDERAFMKLYTLATTVDVVYVTVFMDVQISSFRKLLGKFLRLIPKHTRIFILIYEPKLYTLICDISLYPDRKVHFNYQNAIFTICI